MRVPVEADDLTPREYQILVMLSHGKTKLDIAEALFISPHTVKSHFKNLYEKMDVHTAHQAVAYGFMDGILG